MKKLEIVLFTFIFLCLSYVAVDVTVFAGTNHRLFELGSLLRKTSPTLPIATTSSCSDQPAINLSAATDPHLLALKDYQESCRSFVVNQLMLFEEMPNTSANAKERAVTMAGRLSAFRSVRVRPLVVVEPVTEWGLIDYKEFSEGFYDSWISDYFKALKQNGVTQEQMGTWVPFPEPNLPYWNNQSATPADFAAIVNRYSTLLRAEFPSTEVSILLNSATYDSSDFNWENGDYTSLLPYVAGLNKGAINSVGLQGFPWMPKATQAGNGIFDAAEYLKSAMIIEVADSVGVKKIWFNTGSFIEKYTLDPELKTSVSAGKRKDVLLGTLNQIRIAKEKGYDVTVNIFAEDKSQTAEATNWSYLASAEHASVFAEFVRGLNALGVQASLYDYRSK